MWRFALVAALGACGARSVVAPRPSVAPVAHPDPTAPTARVDRAPADLGADDARTSAGGVVLSRLPARHGAGASAPPPVTGPASARGLVGWRDPRPPLVAALAWSAQLTGRPAPPVDGPVALVAWAQAAEAWRAVPAIHPGDLVVFDRAVGGAPASLVAVALGRDDRGVVEVLYVGAGVVRRGFFDVTRPRLRRDGAHAIVNTSLRHNRDQPPRGTKFLAGELFAGVITTAALR